MTLLDRLLDVLRYRVLRLPRPWWHNLGSLGDAVADGDPTGRAGVEAHLDALDELDRRVIEHFGGRPWPTT